MRSIYYGISTKPTTGGHHVNVQHVRALRQQCLRAYLLYWPAGTEVERFETDVPVVLFSRKMVFHPEDIVVLPEGWRIPLDYFSTQGCRKIIHCQNPFYIFNGVDQCSDYERLGVHSAIVCSKFTGQWISRLGFHAPIHVVRPSIDEAFIKPIPSRSERLFQIAYMPRKMPTESRFIMGLFKAMYPQFSNVPWIPIQGKTLPECAAILRQSAVFAAFGHIEGLGLPPLEAMASGCVVAGFHGGGGLEYATERNGFWVGPGDSEGCAHAIASALVAVRDGTGLERLNLGMQETTSDYTKQAFESNLGAVWQNILKDHRERFLLDTNRRQNKEL
jgi:hypothetical protein